MGEHTFGKRARNRNRKLIVRAVPAIVSEQEWQAAEEVLVSNRIMCRRNLREPYLLRGLIRCGICGLSYSGLRGQLPQRDHYYRCNGRQQARGLYGLSGRKCPSKGLNGDYVERLVWADIESFLRNPGEILERLRERVAAQDGERQNRQKELDALRDRLQQKTGEKDRVLGLFRRGRIDEALLDQQLDQIDVEGAELRNDIEAATRALSAVDCTGQLQSAEALLATLRTRLSGPIPPELKRRIVEILVEKIEANTVERWGVQQSEIVVTYRFSQPNEPAALVLPRHHKLRNRNRPPEELNTLGDHLLRRRLVLKLLQRQVAEQIGVDKTSITNWEIDSHEARRGVYARDHPVPRVQPAATCAGLGRSAGAVPHRPRPVAKGRRSPHRSGSGNAGEMGTGRKGATGRIRSSGIGTYILKFLEIEGAVARLPKHCVTSRLV